MLNFEEQSSGVMTLLGFVHSLFFMWRNEILAMLRIPCPGQQSNLLSKRLL